MFIEGENILEGIGVWKKLPLKLLNCNVYNDNNLSERAESLMINVQTLCCRCQDPVLFSGTLRFNVDPLIVKSELEIWEALRRAHLDKFVNSLTEGLDYECGEGGLNLR